MDRPPYTYTTSWGPRACTGHAVQVAGSDSGCAICNPRRKEWVTTLKIPRNDTAYSIVDSDGPISITLPGGNHPPIDYKLRV